MRQPQRGDLLVWKLSTTYVLVDAVTYEFISMVPTLSAVSVLAATRAGVVWQQPVDEDGRAVDEPTLCELGTRYGDV